VDSKNLAEAPAFITKDGLEIREWLAHRHSAAAVQMKKARSLRPGL
jgi:hypothetical protein